MNSNEYESDIYTIDEIKSVINKSKNNCDFAKIFDNYFFKNNSNSKNFKDFYLAFLFGNMEKVSSSKIRNNDYDYLPRQSQEYSKNMEYFEELLSKWFFIIKKLLIKMNFTKSGIKYEGKWPWIYSTPYGIGQVLKMQ